MPRLLAGLGVFVLALCVSASAWAVPRMSLIAGTPCDACHINHQGAGMRTEIGWGTGAFTGQFMYEDIGLEDVSYIESNFYLEGLVGAGIDVRLQAARLGRPGRDEDGEVALPDRVVIPMQLQPYLAIAPTDWLTLYGTYNVDAQVFRGGDGPCDTRYAGTSCFEAIAKFQPDPMLPTLRVGQMQPYIGVRHDDHTMWIRRDASQLDPIIAPNYAEFGADLSYQPVYWFRADAGGYVANKLSESIHGRPPESGADVARDVVALNDLAYSARAQFLPQFSDLGVTSWLGASVYGAGDFLMQNYFVGVGKKDLVAVMLEGSLSGRGEDADHETLNLMGLASWQIFEWLILEGRYERATTQRQGEDFLTQAGVLSVQYFPLPYIELRPEYRATFVEGQYSLGQFTMQLHLFY